MTSCFFLYHSLILSTIFHLADKISLHEHSANGESHRILQWDKAKQEQSRLTCCMYEWKRSRRENRKVLRALRWIQHMIFCCYGSCFCCYFYAAARLPQKQATVCPILKNKLPSSWQPSHREKIKQSPLVITCISIDMMIYRVRLKRSYFPAHYEHTIWCWKRRKNCCSIKFLVVNESTWGERNNNHPTVYTNTWTFRLNQPLKIHMLNRLSCIKIIIFWMSAKSTFSCHSSNVCSMFFYWTLSMKR